jgi:hypothetical protein
MGVIIGLFGGLASLLVIVYFARTLSGGRGIAREQGAGPTSHWTWIGLGILVAGVGGGAWLLFGQGEPEWGQLIIAGSLFLGLAAVSRDSGRRAELQRRIQAEDDSHGPSSRDE